MTTSELTCIATLRAAPGGEVELERGEADASVYGPVEIAWFEDRLRITAFGAGPRSMLGTYLAGDANQDVVLEVRLPALGELTETLPGAD